MIGILRVAGSALSVLATSRPSSPGILTSSRIRSGGSSAMEANASAPPTAVRVT